MERPHKIPETPGVYIYKNAEGRIIYVGKARNLRRRVLSYFRPPEQLTSKTRAMIGHAASVEFLSTNTEKEALLLEASLIKKHRPHYNIVLRDDKQYVMFRIDERTEFPRLEVVRKMKKDGARYFGPFTSAQAARETWKSMHKTFALRRCTDRAMKNRVRPCLYHHIGLCLAPCSGEVDRREYAELIKRVVLLLSGKSVELIDILTKSMEEASENLEFERAAALRDQRAAIQKTVERQGVVLANGGDMDVLGLVSRRDGLALGVVFVRGGKVMDRSTFFWPALGLEEAGELILSFLTQFYSPDSNIPPRIVLPWNLENAMQDAAPNMPDMPDMPDTLAVAAASPAELAAFAASTDMPSASAVPDDFAVESDGEFSTPAESSAASSGALPITSSAESPAKLVAPATADFAVESSISAAAPAGISSTPASPSVPPASQTDSELAEEDAIETSVLDLDGIAAMLGEWRGGHVRILAARTPEDHQLVDMAKSNAREAALRREETPLEDRLAVVLHASQPVRRIECVDISHTGGQSTKAGAIIFEHSRPLKDDYRVWNIEGADGDDYAALTQWAQRRLDHDLPWPDLMLIDGGKGQIAAVYKIFSAAFPEQLPFILAGIAKARDEEGHADRRAGNISDRIFLPNRSNPLPIHPGSAELLFLQSVRDTAHDFVIGRHRKARAKKALDAELLRLPGVGPTLARILWDNFHSLDDMRSASSADLEKIDGIGKKRAIRLAEILKKL